MKIDRLLGITIYLLNHGRTSARALSEHFEVSTRTIMRDIDTLSIAGIPISSNYGTDGGYEILDTYKLNSQLAGEGDYEYTVAALQGLASAFADKEIVSTLEKVKSLASDNKAALSMDLSAACENSMINDHLHIIHNSIKAKKFVKFQYTNAKDEIRNVIVEPIAVQYKWYNWYLIAYNYEHQSYCMYKLVRMNNIGVFDRNADLSHSVSEAETYLSRNEDQRNKITVRLLCNGRLRSRCQEYLNGCITEEHENGEFIYELTVPEEEQFWYGVVLSFGSAVTVLEPESLINRIIKNSKDLIAKYE